MMRWLMLTATVMTAGVWTSGQTTAAPVRHPRLHEALYEMREAQKELKGGRHNFGGHRDRAVQDLEAAIVQTEKALASAGDPYRAHSPGRGVYDRYKSFPHLNHALNAIRQARAELSQSRQNFGTHRDKAINALDAAAVQVEKCIQHSH